MWVSVMNIMDIFWPITFLSSPMNTFSISYVHKILFFHFTYVYYIYQKMTSYVCRKRDIGNYL
jgi:hypothetical protein